MSELNSALSNKWQLHIPKEIGCETFLKCVQSVTTPNITIQPSSIPNNMGMVRGNEVGTNIGFTPVTVRFKIDEEWESYKEIYEWMVSMVNFQTGRSIQNVGVFRKPESIMLYLMDTENDKIVKRIRLVDAWPSELSEVELSYTESNAMELFCNVVFMYNYTELLNPDNEEPIGLMKGNILINNGVN